MRKTEVTEIRKLFGINNTNIDKIVGYYVDAGGNTMATFNRSFLNLEDEEMIKWLDLFKKGFGGTVTSKEFPLEQEKSGGAQDSMYALLKTGLNDKQINDAFFNKLADSDADVRNRLYVLLHCTYDVPGKNDGESDVYDFVMGYIFPVELDKPALAFDESSGEFKKKDRTWEIKPSEMSFIYPSFEDRTSDIHTITFCIKKQESYYTPIISDIFGLEEIVPAEKQKTAFTSALTDALEEQNVPSEDKLELIRTIQDNITEKIGDGDPSNMVVNEKEIKKLLCDSGVSEAAAEKFTDTYKQSSGGDKLNISNAVMPSISVEVPDVRITVKDEAVKDLTIKKVGGKSYVMVPCENGAMVNGVYIK